MVTILTSLFTSHALAADEGAAASATAADLAPVFPAKLKKGSWDPKGKTIEAYGRGDAKRKQEAWAEAIPLLVESLTTQPGCGKCLDSLARTLDGAKRHADAAQVGELMARLYPDRGEGWARVTDAWEHANDLDKAVDATTRYLEVKKDDAAFWTRRNSDLVALGRIDEADALLKTASEAGVANEDVKCLQAQNLAASGKPVEAREVWPICTESANATLKRVTEGWLVLAEGTDPELAVTRLSLAGDTNYVRLIQAFVRIDQGKYDLANNLAQKAITEADWALDAYLAQAQALLGLGKGAEAAAVLDQHFMGAGWAERNAKISASQVLLRMRGTAWPAQVGQRAEVLKVAVLASQGDYAAAWALRDEVLKANGDSAELQAALQSAMNTPIGKTGAGRAQIVKSLAASPALLKCQDKAKKPTGTIVYGVTLGADGALSDAKTLSRTITAPELEKCTLAELAKVKLEVAPGSQPVSVTLPVGYPL